MPLVALGPRVYLCVMGNKEARSAARPLRIVASPEGPERPLARSVSGPIPAELPLHTLTAARLVSLDEGALRAEVQIGGAPVSAALDLSVHPVVLRTALARGERVMVQREIEGYRVLGVLRTAPTPGIDEAEEYVLKARRIHIEAEHEATVVSGRTGIFVRALGQVETLADTITSRAASVHKIIGRIIRLN